MVSVLNQPDLRSRSSIYEDHLHYFIELWDCFFVRTVKKKDKKCETSPQQRLVVQSWAGLSAFYVQRRFKAAAVNICSSLPASRESSSLPLPPSLLTLTCTSLCLNPGATSIIHAASGAAPPRADMCHAHWSPLIGRRTREDERQSVTEKEQLKREGWRGKEKRECHCVVVVEEVVEPEKPDWVWICCQPNKPL